ncbi:MAG: FMN-binding protein, partial [Clostridia bacterium]|nr:FMN-binding protein [Clostridia bacterium]
GGAKRDTAGRVLDWNENPIPGLYEAGQLGSYVSNLYQNGVFLSEAMLSGRAAAQTAFGGKSEIKVYESNAKTGPAWEGKADGVYTGTAENLHGNVTVNFTVEGGKLTKIEVVSGELFITADQLAAYLTSIVDAQDPTVDMVSGATVDCQAITSAMTAAFAD